MLETMLSDEERGFQFPEPTHDIVMDVVLDLMESGGYEAVQLREVAKRSRVGLGTIYKLFTSRDYLIVATLQRWMAANAFAELAPRTDEETVYEAVMRFFRAVFEPWERSPRLLEAFYKARSGPGGKSLPRQGFAAAEPVVRAAFAGHDPGYVHDAGTILTNVVYGLLARFAGGDIEITDLLPALERTVARLTMDNRADASPNRLRPNRSGGERRAGPHARRGG